jgi:hypothetical protein
MKTSIPPVLITFALVCFALVQNTQAVTPAPDGGYPNFTTAEGTKALFNLTTGSANTAVGWFSLFSNAGGSFNTATGAGSLLFNTVDDNTAFGAAALLFNSTGINNTAVGAAALLHNTIAEENTATGAFALFSNTEGDFNTANGSNALFSNITGERNTATGTAALFSNNTGSRNTANGNPALVNNTAGDDNTAIGAFALQSNTTGDQNTATGVQALSSNTTGIVNTATGYQALQSNTDGTSNTADGVGALQDTTTGGGNTGTGYQALLHNDSGDYNTAIGLFALGSITTGSNNTGLGRSAGTSVTTADHVICIGDNVSGANVSNSCYIGSIFGQTSSGGTGVFINNSGKLGTTTSSRRFKEEIKRMDTASKALFALQPVTFRYKKEIDPQSIPQFGLVAEEVEKVNPDLVVRDTDGKPYTVRYDQVNAMLLNEFLKEHSKNEEQEKTIAELKSGMTALAATMKEHAAQIQKVSAQLAAASPSRGGLEGANLRRKWSTIPKAAPIFVADAHRGDGKRFVVHADKQLTAFLELESVISGSLLTSCHGSVE